MIRHRHMTGIAAGVVALTIAAAPLQAQQPRVRVPEAVLQRYAGEYDQDGSIIRISVSGDTLFREVPGKRIILAPISETLFKMGEVFTVEFVPDQVGGMTQIVASGTLEFRLPRKGSAATPPPAPATVNVPRSVLERYAGVYEYLPGQMGRTDLRIVIHLEGDRLVRDIMGKQTLIPISETRFQVEGTSLTTEFVVDDAGVTQVLGRGFQQLIARQTIND